MESPFFDFHLDEDGVGVNELKHLRYNAGKGTLEGIYGMSGNLGASGWRFGWHGISFTWHDRKRCDVYHHLPEANNKSNEFQIWHWVGPTVHSDSPRSSRNYASGHARGVSRAICRFTFSNQFQRHNVPTCNAH